MKNQVIQVLTRSHGKKVIEYWKSQGVDTGVYAGSITAADGGECRYYGVINGVFSNYTLSHVTMHQAEVIRLPEDNSDAVEVQKTLNQVKMKCSYKGDLSGVPDPIVHKMLEHQELQGNKRDVSVFENNSCSNVSSGGFTWHDAPEGHDFWTDVLVGECFDVFFKRYPELLPEADAFDIQQALTRIEAKLDRLLKEKADPEEVNRAEDFSVGDKVRVKSWKEIKAMTKKDERGDRVYSDGSLFLREEKPACGKIGEVIRSVSDYVPVRGEVWEYLLAPQALEKVGRGGES